MWQKFFYEQKRGSLTFSSAVTVQHSEMNRRLPFCCCRCCCCCCCCWCWWCCCHLQIFFQEATTAFVNWDHRSTSCSLLSSFRSCTSVVLLDQHFCWKKSLLANSKFDHCFEISVTLWLLLSAYLVMVECQSSSIPTRQSF